MPVLTENSNAGAVTDKDLQPHQRWHDRDSEPWHLPHMAVMLQTQQPRPAEACTDVGADDYNGPPATRLGMLLMLLSWLVLIAACYVVIVVFKH